MSCYHADKSQHFLVSLIEPHQVVSVVAAVYMENS